MSFEPIWRDAVTGVAGVTVYDKGHDDVLGRYMVAKTMKLPNGSYRKTDRDYHQRPAALAHARKFLEARAAKAGTVYKPGAGKETIGYKPVPWHQGEAA